MQRSRPYDWAASAPIVDFEVNALATLQLMERVRARCPRAVFIYVSTNKVYGDTPNSLPLVEHETRWEVDPSHAYAAQGVPETMSVDATMHSLFGCSKLAADVMVQEYGRYFGMRTACCSLRLHHGRAPRRRAALARFLA